MAIAAEALTAFSSEEEALMAALRDKYGSRGTEPPPPAASNSPTAQQLATTQVVKACHACQGAGSVVESYAGRALQRRCPACGGDGCSAGPRDAAAAAQNNSTSSRAAEQQAAYERELKAIQQSLACCADPQEAALRAELALQLERHLVQLRAAAA